MNPKIGPVPVQRFHDLDALRAFAMLLGIALHAALAFTGFPWIVQDSHSSPVFALMVGAIHGFRMQLFMFISGFFTMMLYRKRGLLAVFKQRCRRVLIPCLIGLVTIVPLLDFVSYRSIQKFASQSTARPDQTGSAIYSAIRRGDVNALKKELRAGADPNQLDTQFRIPLLGWAALKGDVVAARALIDAGARVDQLSGGGHRPIHHAAFLGHANLLELLAEKGANLAARSSNGESAVDITRADEQTTRYFLELLGLKIKPDQDLYKGRQECLRILEKHIDTSTVPVPLNPPGILSRARLAYSGWLTSDRFLTSVTKFGQPIHLFQTDIFHHLWFLWYLCWLAALFVMTGLAFGNLPDSTHLWRRLEGARGFATLIVLTMIPQLFMGTTAVAVLGPDTATGVLPMPHLLLYYGFFFLCGAFLFDAGTEAFQRIDQNPWWLRIGLCVAFPATLAAYANPVASGVAQSVYAWSLIFGLIRLFRKWFNTENQIIRYLSDSSYWLYLAHLPLVVLAQSWVRPWNLPSGVKFVGLTACSTALLLISYQALVRHSWIGRLLNGSRQNGNLSSNSQ